MSVDPFEGLEPLAVASDTWQLAIAAARLVVDAESDPARGLPRHHVELTLEDGTVLVTDIDRVWRARRWICDLAVQLGHLPPEWPSDSAHRLAVADVVYHAERTEIPRDAYRAERRHAEHRSRVTRRARRARRGQLVGAAA